jgi:hypothetical protein
VFGLLPMPLTTTMIAIEMPAAIRLYSTRARLRAPIFMHFVQVGQATARIAWAISRVDQFVELRPTRPTPY